MGLSFNIAAMKPRHIGIIFKAARDESGLTQQALAHLADTTIDAISAIENGKRTPGWDTLARIAIVLKIHASTLSSAIEYELMNYDGISEEDKRELLRVYRSLDRTKE